MAWLKPFTITGTTAVNLHWKRQHELLAGRPCLLGRGEDGPEIVTRMTEAARRHVAVEKIDVAHKTGVKECCLIR
jgi:hypothetical protein